MADIIVLESHRKSIAIAAKMRQALYDQLANENRDPTIIEEDRIAALEAVIRDGHPRTADDARAMLMLADEKTEIMMADYIPGSPETILFLPGFDFGDCGIMRMRAKAFFEAA